MWQAISLLSTAGRQSSGLAGALDALGFNDPPPPVKFSPLNLPPQFVHYRVEREIAAGGMGMVYDAEDARLGRRVALKMLRRVLFSTKQERLRFQTEAELVSLLDHSNIFPVYDVGVHEGQPYFTMKFIRGGKLGGAAGCRTAATGRGRSADGKNRGPPCIMPISAACCTGI